MLQTVFNPKAVTSITQSHNELTVNSQNHSTTHQTISKLIKNAIRKSLNLSCTTMNQSCENELVNVYRLPLLNILHLVTDKTLS